jgi:hypothetical protein
LNTQYPTASETVASDLFERMTVFAMELFEKGWQLISNHCVHFETDSGLYPHRRLHQGATS